MIQSATPPMSPTSSKVALITGATAGIGRITALDLARRGVSVIIVGRSPERCSQTAKSIRETTSNKNVDFIAADLSSQADVRRLAQEFRAKHNRLDILINNAGALFAFHENSPDGIERTFALNHLGPFLLTSLLLDLLRTAAPSRIINISSDSHESIKTLSLDDLQSPPNYGRSELTSAFYTFLMPTAHPAYLQYARTKLANILFTIELARGLEGTGVTANAVHPGFVATNFTAGNGIYGSFMRFWSRFFAVSTEEGAKTQIKLATDPALATVTGKYFVKEQIATASLLSQDPNLARQLWDLSAKLTGLAPS
jgi:retinol dehydrogenase-12